MLQAMLVTFREGVESFLIVGVIAAYLRRTNRAGLLRGLYVGIGASVVTCLVGAKLWGKVPNQPLYEGIAALTAAALVGALLWQMMRMGRRLKGAIESRIEHAAGAGAGDSPTPSGAPPTAKAVAAVALVTTLLITREGLEAVLYLGVQVMYADAAPVAAGAIAGLVAAAALAWMWSRQSAKVNLAVLLRVTAVFLALFLVQLLLYGIHELAESGVVEGSQAFHDATEPFGPDGRIGQLLSYSLVAAPLLYFVWSRRAKSAPAVASARRYNGR